MTMANEEHLKLLKQGAEDWNQWRVENPDIQPNLSKADLSQVDLSEMDLGRADLSQAGLSEANLSGMNLRGAYLNGVYLSEANLNGAIVGFTIFATIYKSHGQISEAFLRGCGVPGQLHRLHGLPNRQVL
jgi:uncharacterized protein YjbI with pentapeptide repeats